MPNVVFRIRYYSPQDAFLDATKKVNQKKIANRNYYSSNASSGRDYLDYIEDGIKNSGEFDYIDYMGVRENSTGAFDSDGILDATRKKELREALRKTKSVIWDAVISLEEDFGMEKLKSLEDAQEVVKKCLPKFLKENGIAYDNVIWYAGLHRNTDNRHIHLSFFEKKPRFVRKNKDGLFYHRGQITKNSINNMRIYVEETLTSNEFFFIQYQRNTISNLDEVLKKDNIFGYYEKDLKQKISKLLSLIPKGNINYMSKGMEELHPLIDDITMLVIKQNPELEEKYFKMRMELKKRDDYIKNACMEQNLNHKNYMITDKYMQDFKRRCGNKVIQFIKAYEWKVNYEGLSYENQTIQRNIAKKRRTLLLKSTATLSRMVNQEAFNAFEDFQRRLRKAEHDRLVEEGELELE